MNEKPIDTLRRPMLIDAITARPATRSTRRKIERIGEIAERRAAIRSQCGVAHSQARQVWKVEPVGDEAQDRGRVVERVVDVAPLGKRRDDDRGDPRARAPAIGFWRRVCNNCRKQRRSYP
jgi:hypothetical protein